MDLVQRYNIFEFHDRQLWKHLYGVAMGINPAPSFTNIYLVRRINVDITKLIKENMEKMEIMHLKYSKGFLMTCFRFLKELPRNYTSYMIK